MLLFMYDATLAPIVLGCCYSLYCPWCVIVSLHPHLAVYKLLSLPVFISFSVNAAILLPMVLSDLLGHSRPFE